MMELGQILERLASTPASDSVLATLVDVKGSGYRMAGARMLIEADGRSIGTVSGGCLEADLLERAKQVRSTGVPTIISYDLTKDERSVFGLGMGCQGVVRVLLEPARNNDALDFIRECFDRRKIGAITTLISNSGCTDLGLASRIFSGNGNRQTFAELNGLSTRVSSDAAAVLLEKRSRSVVYEDERGALEFFHEVINPPTAIHIFGAGHDAIPLTRLAGYLGWMVTVIDHRPAYADATRFPEADDIIISRPESISDDVFTDANSVAVVMNHNYDSDLAILRRLIDSTARYIGVLGPKDRTRKLLDELGVEPNERLYAPVGLDIGATTPEAIALSIVAEIQTVLAGRTGGFLKDREAPIYDR